VMLGVLSEGRADPSAPEVRLMAANAEAVLRDDGPLITTRRFADGELPADLVTVAVSETPDPLHAEIADRVAALVGSTPVVVPGADHHESYLRRPALIAGFLGGGRQPALGDPGDIPPQ